VETICISKRGGPIFPQEDPDQLRKCVINYPTSVTMVNGTVYIGDTSIISMKVQSELDTVIKYLSPVNLKNFQL